MGFKNKGIKLQIGWSQIIKFIKNDTFAYINICSQIIKIHQQPYICIHQHHVYSLKQVLLPSNANSFNENSLAWQSAATSKSMCMQRNSRISFHLHMHFAKCYFWLEILLQYLCCCASTSHMDENRWIEDIENGNSKDRWEPNHTYSKSRQFFL